MYCGEFISKKSAFATIFSRIGSLFGRGVALSEATPRDDRRAPIEGQEAVPGVRIWYVEHNPNANSEDAKAILTKADFAEFAAIRHLETRNRSLVVRAALRQALSDSVGGKVSPDEWRFARTENGQPILVNSGNKLKFNCSHTSYMSVIVVSTVGDVGVDIADASFDCAADWLCEVMSKPELKALAKLADEKRSGAVSRLWTLKEAYVKMLGTGIAEIGDVAFDLGDDRLLSGSSHDWFLQPVFRTWIVNNQGRRYSVALASGSPTSMRAPLSRCSSEDSRGYSRDRFPALAG
ncbi:4'-phosphopantetheinyl transferase [Hyphomicrobium denitrificans ATCC 51888]|uniref:4'-phosphopantetheinyl transferase n=1 Tax=Hyphomicrobium denitrificans (strain ATCC 51888 / DSM 1869 / NCIMB 11706 / TK 0415) TaxID=582899 RepID=D8JPZ5_HYPDA|nr:4'-phosphopantetheinyl transferase [Hyphomicrobium denitrificans ATCC 51888]